MYKRQTLHRSVRTFHVGRIRRLEVLEDPYEIPSGFSLEPVSYTHLRAHETVLDLVCRLLLEKKKTYKHTLTPTDFSHLTMLMTD